MYSSTVFFENQYGVDENGDAIPNHPAQAAAAAAARRCQPRARRALLQAVPRPELRQGGRGPLVPRPRRGLWRRAPEPRPRKRAAQGGARAAGRKGLPRRVQGRCVRLLRVQ